MKRKAMAASREMSAKKEHWSAGLLYSMKDPDLIVKEDDRIVIINDKYPKAHFHFLVMPKVDIPSIWQVTAEDRELLLYMDKAAEELVKDHKEHEFQIGYHAQPSMQRLHLHVISSDFNSPCLKRKQHWNSFTTPFFLKSKDICKQLENNGKLEKIDPDKCKAYLNSELKCHKCSVTPKNMPLLKQHLLSHLPNQAKTC